MKKYLFLFTTAIFPYLLFAQSKFSNPNWQYFPKKKASSSQYFIAQVKQIYQLNPQDELVKIDKKIDQLGISHTHFQQYHEDIPVEGGNWYLHQKEDGTTFSNGHLVSNLQAPYLTIFSAENALEVALSYFNAEQYAWENEDMNKLLKQQTKDEQATYYPQAKLVWMSPDFSQDGIVYKLAYRLDIFSVQPERREIVYVDAIDGRILQTINQICHFNHLEESTLATGYATYLEDPVSFQTEIVENGYILQDLTRGNGIFINNCNNSHSSTCNEHTFFNPTTNWLDEEDKDGIAVLWGLENTYDYFLNEHNYNSYDGNGISITANVNTNGPQASWSGSLFVFGNGDNSLNLSSFVSLDIVAHEYAHAVTNYTANLSYSNINESKTLHEGISDIWGCVIEHNAHPEGNDWIMGQDITLSGAGVRNVAHPEQLNQPNTYQGNHWRTTGLKAHHNSLVISHWFYLLTEGAMGINDHHFEYEVAAIGIEAAAQIVFRTLVSGYLTPNAGFVDFRSATEQAAIDLFGAASPEWQEVQNAWCAVGVGDCNASIVLTQPNGGEKLEAGENYIIRWQTLGEVANVQLDYSLDNGENWMLIAAAAPNTKSYNWEVPDVDSENVLVRVRKSGDELVVDEGDGVFEIQDCERELGFNYIVSESNPLEVSFSAVVEGEDIGVVEWDFGDGGIGTGLEISHVYSELTEYNLTLSSSNQTCISNGMVSLSFEDTTTTFFKTYDIKPHPDDFSFDEIQLNWDNEFYFSQYDNGTPFSITKLGLEGELIWNKQFNLPYTSSSFFDFKTKHNHLYIINEFINEKVGIQKINKDGEEIWAKIISSPCANDESEINIYGTTITNNEEFVFFAETRDNCSTTPSLFKINSEGNLNYIKKYQLPEELNLRINNALIIEANNNDLLFFFKPYDTVNSENLYNIISRLSSEGNNLWTINYSFLNENCQPRVIKEDVNGNIYLGLRCMTSTSIIIKITSNGQLLWIKQFNDFNIIMLENIQNNTYVIGSSDTSPVHPIFIKLNLNGDILETKNYNHYQIEFTYPPIVTNKGIAIMGERTDSYEIYLTKLNLNGELLDCYFDENIILNTSVPTFTTENINVFTSPLSTEVNTLQTSTPVENDLSFNENYLCPPSCDIFLDFNNLPICKNQLISIKNLGQRAAQMIWKINEQVVSEGMTLNYVFEEVGTYNIKLIAINGDSCQDSLSKVVTVHPVADIPNLAPIHIKECGISPAYLISGISDMEHYKWYLNNQLIAETPIFEATKAGHYVLEVQDHCGAVAADTTLVLVDDNCPYPGDCNYDGIANALDLLYLGFGYGASGPARWNASTNWQAQHAFNWSQATVEGLNYKHIDANGDGWINSQDVAVIGQNYNLTHDNAPQNINDASPFSIQLFKHSEIETAPGVVDWVFDVVVFGNQSNSIAYGVYGNILYDVTNASIAHIEMDFTESFLTDTDGSELLQITDISENRIEFAVTRTNYQNALGYGRIGQVFLTIDEFQAGGDPPTFLYETTTNNTISLNNGYFISAGGTQNDFTFTGEPLVSKELFLQTFSQNTYVQLDWTLEGNSTELEQFEIHRSLDGQYFEKIATLPIDKDKLVEDFADKTIPLDKTHTFYYKIVAKGVREELIQSNISSVKLSKPKEMTVFPNPTKNKVHLQFFNSEGGQGQVIFKNITGQQVLDIPIHQEELNSIKTISIHALSTGLYFLEFWLDGVQLNHQKLIIQ